MILNIVILKKKIGTPALAIDIGTLSESRHIWAVDLVLLSRNPVTSHRENEGETMAEKISQKVFIVHGHDKAAKEAVARLIEKLGLEAIILDEQSGGLQAIVDKFEEQAADIVFAIILLTPDDVGAAKAEKNELQSRARQNVILELGYFIGKLNRNQICLLRKKSVELPSDISGQSYVLMDDHDGWQLKLAREMKRAKLTIDANKLL
ncbi:hypothetical protein F4Y43_15560 [Candidatus Poribacteria bacterium]|nr:hypothetical protein [Candidatus Poribacteria bacterium]